MHSTPSRRDFLKAGATTAASLSLAGLPAFGASQPKDINCILLFLVGGPSQLETFDPKPNAPSHVRGPFGAIRTSVPGIHLSETLPRTAAIMDKIALVRTVHHTSAPIHETGQQLMQTGRLCVQGHEPPHFGAVLSYSKGDRRDDVPNFVVTPTAITNTGVSVGHGQSAGHLGARHEPTKFDEKHDFARSCRDAVALVEAGTRTVVVNMFDTVFNKVTWDCHADGGSLATTLSDYRDTLCPMFDRAYTSLIEDLAQRGMLDTTLVLAMGEFGRTPIINPRGGRDHWTGCWSMLFAGAGVRGGQVIGASDAWAAEPKDRPVTPAEIAATVYARLGLNPRQTIPGPDGKPMPLADGEPIRELVS